MKLIISKLLFSDLEEVLAIETRSYALPWTRGIFEHEIQNEQCCYYIAARLQNKLVGYAGIWSIWKEGHLTNVTVHPEFRCRGIGKSMIVHLLEFSQARRFRLLTLEVRASNEAGLRLYRSFGFEEVGIRKGYYLDNNEDAIIMHFIMPREEEMRSFLEKKKSDLYERYHLELVRCAVL